MRSVVVATISFIECLDGTNESSKCGRLFFSLSLSTKRLLCEHHYTNTLPDVHRLSVFQVKAMIDVIGIRHEVALDCATVK